MKGLIWKQLKNRISILSKYTYYVCISSILLALILILTFVLLSFYSLSPLFSFWNVTPDQTSLYRSVDIGGSGGYCEYLFRYSAARLFGKHIPLDEPLPYRTQRNADYRELTLELNGRTVLSFALAYGFRN